MSGTVLVFPTHRRGHSPIPHAPIVGELHLHPLYLNGSEQERWQNVGLRNYLNRTFFRYIPQRLLLSYSPAALRQFLR